MMAVNVHETPYWEEACKALKQADPTLGDLIRASRGSVLRPRNDPFFSLARSIVAQQISVSAAEAVWRKFLTHVGEITPGAVVCQTEDTLHKCGLSRPKARYLLGLAEHFTNGAFDQRAWHRMDDEAVIEDLIQVKGIGQWTAEMFLIFLFVETRRPANFRHWYPKGRRQSFQPRHSTNARRDNCDCPALASMADSGLLVPLAQP